MSSKERAQIASRLRKVRAKVEKHEEAGEALRQERDELIRQALDARMTVREVSELVGVSNQRVSQIGHHKR